MTDLVGCYSLTGSNGLQLMGQTGGSHTMGDKGGKKSKDKGQKQKEGKQAQEAKTKQDKQKKGNP